MTDDGGQRRSLFGENVDHTDMLALLGPATMVLPFQPAFGQDMTWYFWHCVKDNEGNHEGQAPQCLHLSASSVADEAALQEVAAAAEVAVQRGEACCAVYNATLRIWYVLDRCKLHLRTASST